MGYTLASLRVLLGYRGVSPTLVDQVAKRFQWVDPVEKGYAVCPVVEKRPKPYKRPVVPVRDALLGEVSDMPPPKIEDPAPKASELPDALEWAPNTTISLEADPDLLGILGTEEPVPQDTWVPPQTPQPDVQIIREPEKPEGDSSPSEVETAPVSATGAANGLPQSQPLSAVRANPGGHSGTEPFTQGVAPVSPGASHWYPGTWFNRCGTVPSHVGVIVPLARTDYFNGPSGERLMKFPAIHKATGTLVYLVSPSTDACPDSVLRDCPQFQAYKPTLPEDLPWAGQSIEGIRCGVTGVLLQGAGANFQYVSY
mgnify:CR=1 FL=1